MFPEAHMTPHVNSQFHSSYLLENTHHLHHHSWHLQVSSNYHLLLLRIGLSLRLYFTKGWLETLILTNRVGSSAVERSIADRTVMSSNLIRPFFFFAYCLSSFYSYIDAHTFSEVLHIRKNISFGEVEIIPAYPGFHDRAHCKTR